MSASSDPVAALDHTVARAKVREALFGTPTTITIDRFTVLERVGEGGMSTVFAAYDPRLDRKIALKLLRSDRDDGTDGSARQTRLLREARAMARLSHPNVGAVHDVGVVDDGAAPQVWIAMEFVAGEGLRAWCSRAKPSAAEIVDAYVQAGRGLAAAHAAGLVHRDFKPDNAMRDASGRVRVLDFGLARTHDDGPVERPLDHRDELLARMPAETPTRTGALVGTPAFLAPEQILGEPADARSDQFAFCVALHEALWGVRPFTGETVAALFDAVLEGQPTPPPRRADVPTRVRAAILRGLSRDPARRWPDLPTLLAVLERRSSGRRIAIAGVLVAASIGGAVVLARRSACADSDRALGAQWGDDTRAAVRAGVDADGRPFTQGLGDRLVATLDDYDAALRAAYHDACVATHEAGVQSAELLDRETACLDARAAGFRAATRLLSDPDAAVIERADALVDGLAPIAACLDRDALLSLRDPIDPALAQPLADIAAQVAEAGAQLRAGHLQDARVVAEQALAEAERIAQRSARASAAGELGLVLRDLGEDARGCELLSQAHFLADAGGQDVLAANTASEMIGCVPVGEDGRAARELWRGNAQAAIDRLADPALAQASLDAEYGYAMLQSEHFDEAIALYEDALALRRERLSPDARAVWSLELDLAVALVATGRIDEGVALADDAAARAERLLGADHPQMAGVLGNVANVHYNAGDGPGSEAAGRRALAVAERSLGRDHRITAALQLNLSAALYMDERWEEAAAVLRDCLDRLERSGRVDTLEWASAAHNYATALYELDRYDEALPIAQRSAAWYETQLDQAESAIGSYQLLSNIQLERGENAEAERWIRLALDAARDLGTSPKRVQLLHNLANVLRRSDRPDESAQVHVEALAAMGADDAPRWEIAQAEYQLARALWDAGERARARALAEASLATIRAEPPTAESGGLHRRDVTPETIERWLAEH